jgi:hypothetical protein
MAVGMILDVIGRQISWHFICAGIWSYQHWQISPVAMETEKATQAIFLLHLDVQPRTKLPGIQSIEIHFTSETSELYCSTVVLLET